MEQLEQCLLEILQNEKFPIGRRELSYVLHTSDRTIRVAIEHLRRKGFKICSSSQIAGYWLGSESEYLAFRREYLARAYKELSLIKTMDNVPIMGQVTLRREENEYILL